MSLFCLSRQFGMYKKRILEISSIHPSLEAELSLSVMMDKKRMHAFSTLSVTTRREIPESDQHVIWYMLIFVVVINV